MDRIEFRQWLQGFKAAGGDPRSPAGRAAIERMLSQEDPDPLCPECPRKAHEEWLERYLSYYDEEVADV
jgi:hypothetical protein